VCPCSCQKVEIAAPNRPIVVSATPPVDAPKEGSHTPKGALPSTQAESPTGGTNRSPGGFPTVVKHLSATLPGSQDHPDNPLGSHSSATRIVPPLDLDKVRRPSQTKNEYRVQVQIGSPNANCASDESRGFSITSDDYRQVVQSLPQDGKTPTGTNAEKVGSPSVVLSQAVGQAPSLPKG